MPLIKHFGIALLLALGFPLYAEAQCTFEVSPTAIVVFPVGNSPTFAITTQSGCAWTAASNVAWATVNSGASGSGSGTAVFNVTSTRFRRAGTFTVAGQTISVTQRGTAAADYDGDGISDLAHFRQSDGSWRIQLSTDGSVRTRAIGVAGDVPISGDFDGDHIADEAVYRRSSGYWRIFLSSVSQTTDVLFGIAGDTGIVPIPADYDNDGRTDLAFYYRPTGTWNIARSTDGEFVTYPFGVAGDPGSIPVPHDYDGDGQADPAFYYRATGHWYIVPSGTGQLSDLAFGNPNDANIFPAPADYDGDGKADLAFYYQATGNWFIFLSSISLPIVPQFGVANDPAVLPVPGDYDGDGAFDLAFYYRTAWVWFVFQTSQQQSQTTLFGSTADSPLLNRREPVALSPVAIGYEYDALGRLAKVTNATGDSATYTYDPVGNLLSITRQMAPTVTLGEFSATSGYGGAFLTIAGTGFSTNAAENIVTFNGKTAVVVSSTSTELRVIVPLGASSGPISIRTPTGSTVSGVPFTVLGNGGLPPQPSITSFTPTNGNSGASVTVTGANFDTVMSANVVHFNAAVAEVTQGTTSALTATVPLSATSGRITLTTPNGEAKSAQDFLIAPSPYQHEDIASFQRVPYLEAVPIDLTQPGKVAVVLFDGTAGEWVNLVITGTFAYCSVNLVVRDPSGTTVASDCNRPTGAIDEWVIAGIRLQQAGTYSVVFDPDEQLTGTLTLKIVPDVVQTLSIGAPPIRTLIRESYQSVRVLFEAAAGDRIGVAISQIAIYSTYVGIQTIDGAELAYGYALEGDDCTDGCIFHGAIPTTGTYMILLDPENNVPAGDMTGGMTISLVRPPADVIIEISANGQPVTVSNTAPGQLVQVMFDATAHQRISLHASPVSMSIFTQLTLYTPGGTFFASAGQLYGSTYKLDAVMLPVSGTYRIMLEPNGASVGSATLTLYDVVNLSASAAIGGPSLPLSFTTPGQNAQVTFGGLEGQRVAISLSNVTVSVSMASLLKPDGSTLIVPTQVLASGKFLDAVLPTAGTYTVVLDPIDERLGNMTLSLIDLPAPVFNSIMPGGPAVALSVATAGQNAEVTFAAIAGQRVSLRITGVTIPSSVVSIRRPDGTTLASTSVTTSGGFIDTNVLASSGTYTIVVDPTGSGTGNMTLTLHDVPADASVTGAVDGSPTTVTVGTPGQGAELTFVGTAGQRIGIELTSVTVSASNVSVVKPDSTVLIIPTSVTASGKFLDAVLPSTGSYILRIDPNGAATGSITITISTIQPDVTATIEPGGSPVTLSISPQGRNAQLSFDASSGQRISLRMTGVTISSSAVTIRRPDGTALASATVGTSGGFIDTQVLNASGTYTIAVDPAGSATGSITLTLHDVPTDLNGTIVPGGPPVTVAIGTPGQNALLTFAGTIGGRVSLVVTQSPTTPIATGVVEILSNGLLLGSSFLSTTGAFINTVTLLGADTNQIKLNPGTTQTGSLTFTLYSVPPAAGGPVVVNGPPVSVSIDTPGQTGALTFDGTIGQQITVHVANQPSTMGSVTVELLDPDQSTLTSRISTAPSYALTAQILPITGPYRITIDPPSQKTGSMVVNVTSP